MPIGELADASEAARARAVTPDYHAHLAQRRAAERDPAADASDREPAAAVDATEATVAGRKSAAGVVPSSLLPTLPPPAGGQRFALDAQSFWGLALLGAMTLIGVGGWFLTGGTYRDAGPTPPPPPAATAPTLAAPGAPGVAGVPTTAQAEVLAGSAQAAASQRPGARSKSGPASVDAPTRDDVRDALSTLQSAFADCAHGRKGTAQLDLSIANTGSVTHVSVGGDFAGTPEGACIARVARTAQFARFKKPRYRIVYPVTL